MPPTNIPLSTIYEIRDQIMARIRPVIDDAISQAATSAVESIPTPILKVPSAAIPDLGIANWIWTNEQPYNEPPLGIRAFRKVEVIPPGQFVDSMVIDIAFDAFDTLYVNGHVVGNTEGPQSRRYSIKFLSTDRVVIAVYGTRASNQSHRAGLVVSAVMWNSANYKGRTFAMSTDGSWETSINAADRGFERLDYIADSSWSRARVKGSFGMEPWRSFGVDKPTRTSEPSAANNAGDWFRAPFAPLAASGPPVEGMV